MNETLEVNTSERTIGLCYFYKCTYFKLNIFRVQNKLSRLRIYDPFLISQGTDFPT